MKLPILLKFSIAFFIVGLSACTEGLEGSPTKAMPASQENLAALSEALQQKASTFTHNPSHTQIQRNNEVMREMFVATIEGKFGYSLDLTIRRFTLFPEFGWNTALSRAMLIVHQDFANAVANNFISQETSEILQLKQASKGSIDSEQLEFISHIQECEKIHEGTCTTPKLIQRLSKLGPKKYKGRIINYSLENGKLNHGGQSQLESIYKINSDTWPKWKQWIRHDNGNPINPNWFLRYDNTRKFKVSDDAVTRSKEFSRVLSEQSKVLF